MEMPFKKILIANRGEIALRVLRACHELGIQTVAVHSTADAEALHVKLATEAVCIGPAPAIDSYLKIDAILSAATATGAQAIHPGYGFLSENSQFVEIAERCGITFIGPTIEQMHTMGDKARAREQAVKYGVPVIPGSEGAGTDAEAAFLQAKKLGFPVLIKASAGGGGRGMKVVDREEDFVRLFEQASREVEAAFKDPNVYVEKLIRKPRHIEVQILGDHYGNLIHLGERDCSMQRRYQKLVEEAPAFGLPEDVRLKIRESALKLAGSINYRNAGTMEFLYDTETGEYYFIEMNTRLQVEHPVTEMISDVDIVKEQIWIAAGRPLAYKQEDIVLSGHAIEVRVNAEDSVRQLPSPGRVLGYHPPGGNGVRVDSALYDRYFVPPYYDSMIAKIITRGRTREEAIKKMLVALDECIVEGISTNLDLHRKILSYPAFVSGKVHTKLLEEINSADSSNEKVL